MGNGKREKGNGNQLELFSEKEEVDTQLLTANSLLDLWHSSFITEGYDSKKDAERARKKGEKLMHNFYNWWKDGDHHAMAVEQSFSINLKDTRVTGRFDRLEASDEGITVIDFKTCRPTEDLENNLQLSLYALAVDLALGEPCKELVLLYLSEDGCEEIKTERSEESLKDTTKLIEELQEKIVSKEFDPIPSESACFKCPYNRICDVSAV